MTAQPVDLAAVAGAGGVVWSASPGDFHANLVVLRPGGTVGAHRNDALDVLVVVLDGSATVTVDGQPLDVPAGSALLVPKGAERAVQAGEAGARYLSIHGRKGPLEIGGERPCLAPQFED